MWSQRGKQDTLEGDCSCSQTSKSLCAINARFCTQLFPWYLHRAITSAIGWLIHAGSPVACARFELFDWEFLAVCVGTICSNFA